MPSNRFFQVGGSLRINLPSYIERKADNNLLQNLLNGEFCYVLTARQMGKSSLKVRAMDHLAKKGWATASVDLTSFGTVGFTIEEWYLSFLSEIADALDLDNSFEEWWEKSSGMTPVARMSHFWEEVLLGEIDQNIVIFIDEIDSILSLDDQFFSTDDFFAAIRAVYNKRSEKQDFQRLNFAIFGVAAPEDLMGDHERTPFNIGIPILLYNFSKDEASKLTAGLPNNGGTNQAVINRIIYWTAGQPYLTQEIGQKMSQVQCTKEKAFIEVDKIVKETFFRADIFNSPHFSNIQIRILANERYNLRMLDIYKNILKDGAYRIAKKDNEHLYLKLSGLVAEENGYLHINNRIYTNVFDDEWLQKAYESIQRPISIDLQRWLNTNRSDDALLKGDLLQEAENWASKRDDLSNEERDFLEASRLAAIKLEQEQLRQQERAKQQKRLRFALITVFLMAVLAIIAAIVAIGQASLATEGEQKAKREAGRADSLARIEQIQRISAVKARDSLNLALDSIETLFNLATSQRNLARQRYVKMEEANRLKARAENESQVAKEQLILEELEKVVANTKETMAARQIPRERAKRLALHSVFEREKNPTLSFRLAESAFKLDQYDFMVIRNLIQSYYDGFDLKAPLVLNKDSLEYPLTKASIFEAELVGSNRVKLLDPQGFELYSFVHEHKIKDTYFTLDNKYLVILDFQDQLLGWIIDPNSIIQKVNERGIPQLSDSLKDEFKIN